jgi:hypothetical protein
MGMRAQDGFGARGLFSVRLGGQQWRVESPADDAADGGGFGARGLFSDTVARGKPSRRFFA